MRQPCHRQPRETSPQDRTSARRGTLRQVSVEVLAQPAGSSVGERLLAELASGRWNDFRCCVAFAKLSGVKYLDGPLRVFTGASGRAVISLGVDQNGTSFEAAAQLAGAVSADGRLVITKDIGNPPVTYHPKVYIFRDLDANGGLNAGLLILGSNNITEGGLFTNHELSTAWIPDLTDATDTAVFAAALTVIAAWQDASSGLVIDGDATTLKALHVAGMLPTEAAISAARAAARSTSTSSTRAPAPKGLAKVSRPAKPKHPTALGAPLVALPPPVTKPVSGKAPRRRRVVVPPPARGTALGAIHNSFCIDITTGKKLTEVYLSKTALNQDPAFFGHPFTGLTTPKQAKGAKQPERDPRPTVDIRLVDAAGLVASHYQQHPLKLWQYVNGPHANQDVRMTIPADLLRSLPAGCILEIRRQPVAKGLDYELTFLSPGSTQHAAARAVAIQPLPGGKRKIGWA